MSEPRCKECDCVTGGAEHCYEHKPYMVYPKADGSFVSDRYGRKNIWFDEPPAPEAPILSAIRALVQQWRETDADVARKRGYLEAWNTYHVCANELAALCPVKT